MDTECYKMLKQLNRFCEAILIGGLLIVTSVTIQAETAQDYNPRYIYELETVHLCEQDLSLTRCGNTCQEQNETIGDFVIKSAFCARYLVTFNHERLSLKFEVK